MAEVQWRQDFEDSLKQAGDEKKPLFLDFFKDGWGGCAKLGAVTYPDKQVAELLNQRFIPVQVDIQKASKLVDRYLALWTPNLNVIDSRGHIVYKEIGWLPPDDFAAMLRIGEGHYRLHRKKYEEATPLFEEVLDRHAKSLYAAEALYYRGVSRYMASHEASALEEDWGELQRRFAGSEWAVKADVM